MQTIQDLFSNRVLLSGLIGWGAAQVLKTIIYALMHHTLDLTRIFGDGGMPSGHSATVCAVATSAGIIYGLDSFPFAISVIVAIIVMHDAMGVRLETGKQAKLLNEFIDLFAKLEQPLSDQEKLKELARGVDVLTLSATPIPRTLALIAYGDLDVSVIAELPPGRRPVETFLVSEALRERLNGFIRKQCAGGHQVYVVCPAVEDGEENTMKSAEGWAQTLRDETFPELRVGLVHGRMKSAEKDAALSAFRAGDYDILVATTVVEVGVDVPNATLMVIENAERFGLSQLHQLRGRVGRGSAQSYCVLVSGTKNEETKKRLQALCKTTDGFKIAEQDLALRGPGDFFGNRQHGLPLLKVASLQMDLETLQDAQQAAAAVIQTADSLNAPELAPLKARVEALFTRQEVSLN